METNISRLISLTVVAASLALAATARAQDSTAGPTVPPQTNDQAPEGKGPVTTDDGSTLQREHLVTTPNGQMTQSWVRSTSEQGFELRREQTWTNPDGTPLREHESTLTGTDPRNFQWDKSVTLRDGRTVEHSYSQTWDGTTLTSERTFTGPNGQTHTSEREWTAPSEPKPQAKRPSGFTLGSSRGGGLFSRGQGLESRQPGDPESDLVLARRHRIEQRNRDPNPSRPQGGRNR